MEWTPENRSKLIQAGGGIASSLINVIGQSYINSQNIEEQRRAQAVAQQNWREQQEYNSPRNQVARIEKAGLNPDMLYGQSSAGVAGNAPTPAQSINPPVLNPIQLDPMLVANIYKNIAEIGVDQSQEDLNNSMSEYYQTKEKTEEEISKQEKIQTYIQEASQDYVISQIQDQSITAYKNRIKATLEVSDAFAESLVKYKALGLPLTVSANGEINIQYKNIDSSYYTSEKFQKALTAYITANYDMPQEQIKQVQETIKKLVSEQYLDYASASNLASEEAVFETTAEKNKLERVFKFAEYYTYCVQNGISIDWSKNPPEIVKSKTGVVLTTIADKLLTLAQGVFGIAFKKTF